MADKHELPPCPFCGGVPYYPTNIKQNKAITSCANNRCSIFAVEMTVKQWARRAEVSKTNHLNCKERAKCGAYRPVPVCQKINQQGCFQELC